MNTATKRLLATAAGIATNQLTHRLSGWDSRRLISPLGSTRQPSAWPTNLAFLGAGALIGGLTGLLLAPSSGSETRAKLARKARELGDAASKQVLELGEQVRQKADVFDHDEDTNNHSNAETQV